jgi:hypothetical protein
MYPAYTCAADATRRAPVHWYLRGGAWPDPGGAAQRPADHDQREHEDAGERDQRDDRREFLREADVGVVQQQRLMVIGQRREVNGLPGGGGDHRPEDLVLVLVVGPDLRQQRCGIPPDSVRPGARRAASGDLAQAGGEPPQVLADRPVDDHDGREVGLGLFGGSGPERERWCGGHVPSVGQRPGG